MVEMGHWLDYEKVEKEDQVLRPSPTLCSSYYSGVHRAPPEATTARCTGVYWRYDYQKP